MEKGLKQILVGVVIGLLVLTGAVWLLCKNLGNVRETLYVGRSLDYWRQQVAAPGMGTGNNACTVVNAHVIPQLIDTMFHDTNDSKIRLGAIRLLNKLPGIQIDYIEAPGRRSGAAWNLGELGPAGEAAVPSLIEAVNGNYFGLHRPAVGALGKIHSNPDVVIPFLISLLTNDDLADIAATSLGNFGSEAKVAVPKILPLLTAGDKDARVAGKNALRRIDPAAADKARQK
jgi:hypothetical protein